MEGSGSRALALEVLRLNGIDEGIAALLPLTPEQSADALLRGEIDAAVIVGPWESGFLRRLLASSDVDLVGFPRADAYTALHPYLTKLVLPAGMGNLATNRPPTDVSLIAPKASLIIRRDLHPSLQYLLLETAAQIHGAPGVFRAAGQFPAAVPDDLPLSSDARQFYKTGSPLLQRYLPFWLAVFASRLLALLIPVMGIAYPLLRWAPAIFAWSMRWRILRLYGELKTIEAEFDRGARTDELLRSLKHLQESANQIRLPVSFAPLLYRLRSDIALVQQRVGHGPQ